MREMVLTMRMMRRYTADEVLTLYLNQMPYGSGIYGIEAAAQHYFNKSTVDLTLGEAAARQYLSHFPTMPDPAQLKEGQAIILERMVMHGYITKEQAQQAQDEPLQFADPGQTSSPIR
ncbi:MAG: transglycosylase domain-containing protein [Anaerolineae bacterium]|nr:transglycosylase domain-containing protein [Anaerolineae bacterium]